MQHAQKINFSWVLVNSADDYDCVEHEQFLPQAIMVESPRAQKMLIPHDMKKLIRWVQEDPQRVPPTPHFRLPRGKYINT
ncbi:hypothetical protein A6R68_17054 [Neotoma lepida]|uniref:Uncharacterized protein n=1 Tax=Neotoma lepida TaxID=56216 RepID=A0A1A6HD54_NEOLE|nr:hypothetical protein A6R68_17054 [Neotoma lepida]